MTDLTKKLQNQKLRKNRIRAKVNGSATRPRLSVFISNLHVSAQIINDETGETLVASTTVGNKTIKGSLTEKAVWVGQDIATKATKAKIKQIVFDRAGKKYHGRTKALADAAREKGLEF